MPKKIVNRKKHGFGVPVGELINTTFKEEINDTLRSRKNLLFEDLNYSYIVNLLDDHINKVKDNKKKIWP